MNESQKCLLGYLQVLRKGAVDTMMMAGMFYLKMEREALPAEVMLAYDELSAKKIDEVIAQVVSKAKEKNSYDNQFEV